MSLHKSDGLQDKVFILDYRESTTPLRVGPGRARLLRDSTPSRQGSTASLRVGRPRLGDSVNATPLALRVGRAQLPGPFPGRAAAASLVQWPSLTIQAPGHWHSESAGFEGPTPSRAGSTALQTEKRGRRPCRRPLLSPRLRVTPTRQVTPGWPPPASDSGGPTPGPGQWERGSHPPEEPQRSPHVVLRAALALQSCSTNPTKEIQIL